MINTTKLRNIISKKSNGNSEISQKYYQIFYFERLLERISKSKYNGEIILKGGLLLTSIIGDDNRTTKDMDTTLKGIPLNKEIVSNVFKEIFEVDINDGVSFEIISVKDIRKEDIYGGFRLNILSKLENNKTYITVELTTGDKITPKEMKYSYNFIFENKKISIMSYTLETVLAEKIHSVLTLGTLTTRLKDYYDIYILMFDKRIFIDKIILKNAIKNTFENRNVVINIDEFKNIVNDIANDDDMKYKWKQYQERNEYAKNISFIEIINSINKVLKIMEEEK